MLDVDGVLHPLNDKHFPDGSTIDEVILRTEEEEEHWEEAGYSTRVLPSEFVEEKLGLLRRIVTDTGAAIVLSSTWRQQACSRKAVEIELGKVGLGIVAMTGSLGAGFYRSDEIWEFVEGETGKDELEVVFVALDDDDLTLGSAEGKGGLSPGVNFIRTDKRVGLTEDDAKRAIELLKG